MIKKKVIVPIDIAGGSANWSMRTNWYNVSDPTIPKWWAALTTPIPMSGKATYRTTRIPTVSHTPTPDLFKPKTKIWKILRLYQENQTTTSVYFQVKHFPPRLVKVESLSTPKI